MSHLSPEFIEAQRERLLALRAQLLAAEYKALTSARASGAEDGEEAGEAVNKAQDPIQRDIERALHEVDVRRLRNIDRALQKIAEGTYGLSDISGKPIPKERLEAVPEAVMTAQEEAEAAAAARS